MRASAFVGAGNTTSVERTLVACFWVVFERQHLEDQKRIRYEMSGVLFGD
jgi:hypothetical protein